MLEHPGSGTLRPMAVTAEELGRLAAAAGLAAAGAAPAEPYERAEAIIRDRKAPNGQLAVTNGVAVEIR